MRRWPHASIVGCAGIGNSLPWLFGRGAGTVGRTSIRRHSDHWPVEDARQSAPSLSAPAAFLTLVAACLVPSASPWVWTGFSRDDCASCTAAFLIGINPPRRGISKRTHFRAMLNDSTLGASQIVITVTMLAYQTWLMSDAILRTLDSHVYHPQASARMDDRQRRPGTRSTSSSPPCIGAWPAAYCSRCGTFVVVSSSGP